MPTRLRSVRFGDEVVDARYELRVRLLGGEVISEPVTEAQTDALFENGGWFRTSDDQRLEAIERAIAARADSESGSMVVTDVDGRTWHIEARLIQSLEVIDRSAPQLRPLDPGDEAHTSETTGRALTDELSRASTRKTD